MRTLSLQELIAVAGAGRHCHKPVKKPKCIKLPTPPKCGTKPPVEPPPVDPAPAG